MLSKSNRFGGKRFDPNGLETDRDFRLQQLLEWLNSVAPEKIRAVERASGDASFRRYFRVHLSARTLIAMDAPPAVERIRPFIRVSILFAQAGVCVPKIFEFNEDQGFMLLTDFGAISYLSRLDPISAPALYQDATNVLRRLNSHLDIETCGLPEYSVDLFHRELGLFEQWFLSGKLAMALTSAELRMLEQVKKFLINKMLEQPKIVVHRDFHSRNLMVLEQDNPGVLDFQDAVVGPVTYDLVSLLRDCYIAWPEPTVEQWVFDYFSNLGLHKIDFEQFFHWFELTGLQRHMKAVGIFSRLDIRDGRTGYLADIPRTLNYIRGVSAKYAELSALHDFVTTSVAERMEAASLS